MLPDLRIWLNHFEYHADQPRRVPSHIGDGLSLAERALIARPLAVLLAQHRQPPEELLRAAYCFSEAHAAPEVARIAELLLRESRQHARLIGVFMRRHHIPLPPPCAQAAGARSSGVGGEFHRLLSQRLSGQLSQIVCYRALEKVTGNQQLRLLCRMVVAEQLAHIGFTTDLLVALRTAQPPLGRLACGLRDQGGALLAAARMWREHRSVLARAGYGLRQFLMAARQQYVFHMQPLPRTLGASDRC